MTAQTHAQTEPSPPDTCKQQIEATKSLHFEVKKYSINLRRDFT